MRGADPGELVDAPIAQLQFFGDDRRPGRLAIGDVVDRQRQVHDRILAAEAPGARFARIRGGMENPAEGERDSTLAQGNEWSSAVETPLFTGSIRFFPAGNPWSPDPLALVDMAWKHATPTVLAPVIARFASAFGAVSMTQPTSSN
jgi:hypothetical protein